MAGVVDTMRLKSPHIGDELADAVGQSLQLREGLDLRSGEVLWSFTTGRLEGSFDTRVSVEVKRQKWVKPDDGAPYLADCAPFLVVEGSVHKAMLGHNVFGGPVDPRAAGRWFIERVGALLGVQLPDGDRWWCDRVDWAEVFDLGSFEAVQEYVGRLNAATFPRREVARFGAHALHCPGATTTLKLYHKGVELRKHDRKRLLKVWSAEEVESLLAVADGVLRFETGIHARTLSEAGLERVAYLEAAQLQEVHDREAARLLREGRCDMERVRTHQEVSRRLEGLYGAVKGRHLFGTWMQLAALGEDEVKRQMTRTSFYRQRRQLQDAGVEWCGADVRIVPSVSLVPAGFAPVRSDPRRLTAEAPEVRLALAPWRNAA